MFQQNYECTYVLIELNLLIEEIFHHFFKVNNPLVLEMVDLSCRQCTGMERYSGRGIELRGHIKVQIYNLYNF